VTVGVTDLTRRFVTRRCQGSAATLAVMSHLSEYKLVLMDAATATALAQILPVLLLTLTVELRRTELHRRQSARILLGMFLLAFGVIETVLVLSIDGMFYPFQGIDLLSALTIFGLLIFLFRLSFVEGPPHTTPPSAH
jgi:hypothetical protein